MRGNAYVRGALIYHHGQESGRFFWGGGLLDHKLYLKKYSTLILIVFNPHCGKFCIYMGDFFYCGLKGWKICLKIKILF